MCGGGFQYCVSMCNRSNVTPGKGQNRDERYCPCPKTLPT